MKRPGRSIENAITILAGDGFSGVAVEYKLIEALYGRRDQGWAFAQQRLLVHADRYYDEITVVTPDDKEHVIYFDIRSFLQRDRPFRQPATFRLADNGMVVVVALP